MTRLCLAIVSISALLILSVGLQPATRAAPAVEPQPAFRPTSRDGVNAATAVETGRSLAHRLQSDLTDGKLDQFTLLQAALIAGGVESADELATCTRSFESHCQQQRQHLAGGLDRHERCDAIVSWLHGTVLVGDYQADCSSVARTLSTGEYNCLTATILFQVAATAAGLDCRAVTSGSHVINVVRGEPALFVETTQPDLRATTLIDARPATQQVVRGGRELSDVQLLGKVYYNLGVEGVEAGAFSQAAQWLQLAGELDQEDTLARQNLLATWNNWALVECDRGRHRQAVELVWRGLAVDGNDPLLRLNDLHIHQQWVRALCDAGDFASAIDVLERAARRRPDTAWFSDMKSSVLKWKTRQNGQSGRMELNLPEPGL